MSSKLAFIAKSGREKRNLERQKARLLTKEEQDRLQELENKRLVRIYFCFVFSDTLSLLMWTTRNLNTFILYIFIMGLNSLFSLLGGREGAFKASVAGREGTQGR